MSDPDEDTYRRVRITSDHFHYHVWQYIGAQEFMWICGWMEVRNCQSVCVCVCVCVCVLYNFITAVLIIS